MTVIKIENLSKYYRLGLIGGGTLREDVNRWIAALQGKPDPLLKVGETDHGNRKGGQVWALRDVNLEVKEGEILGIIGRNGAGKSTLLKILSRITAPTSGSIKIKGRVASLLEVGTGFHPELTGRENIYLNGTILGMNRAEVARKLDEIVEFAEMSQFIDTPVKRYSSGMTVRLAFAVAAHLDPEILVVDEVLAVGDVKFQRKCIKKMEDVGHGGRTVLFVSHNMATISSLCQKGVLLDAGRIEHIGQISEVVTRYYTNMGSTSYSIDFCAFSKPIGDQFVELLKGEVVNDRGEAILEIPIDTPFRIVMEYRILKSDSKRLRPNFHFYTSDGTCVFISGENDAPLRDPGLYRAECLVPGTLLNEGVYYVGLAISSFESGVQVHFWEKNCLTFNVNNPIEGTKNRGHDGYARAIPGVVRPKLDWQVARIS